MGAKAAGTADLTLRRRRYFAYERRSGGTCYFSRDMHEHMQRYPHTIGHYQLTRCLGTSALMTREQAASHAWLPKPAMRTP